MNLVEIDRMSSSGTLTIMETRPVRQISLSIVCTGGAAATIDRSMHEHIEPLLALVNVTQ